MISLANKTTSIKTNGLIIKVNIITGISIKRLKELNIKTNNLYVFRINFLK